MYTRGIFKIVFHYYQSIDLDKITKEELDRIVKKIKSNDCCLDLKVKDSSTKGYHILLTCKIKCDNCRFVFDDQKRYEIDFNRDEKFKNTSFNEKEFFRGKISTLKHTCDRCEKYGKFAQSLTKKELTFSETKRKMRIGMISDCYPPELVYIGFTYLECPICHWFKFVRNDKL